MNAAFGAWTVNDLERVAIFLGALLLLAGPLGLFMARIFTGKRTWVSALLDPVERQAYRLAGVRPDAEMTWRGYAGAVLLFNLAGLLLVYALQRLQGALPFNPDGLPGVAPDLAFNTAVSFATNTNWQAYGGETTMSWLTQMLALCVQNFVSAATGIAVLVALARGVQRQRSATIGSFWVDLVRATLHVLLPLSVLLALALVVQGVPQTLQPAAHATLTAPTVDGQGAPVTEQVIARGPVASQVAIKQLGTNGGGFFNVNSAHPFENPTPVSNLLQMLAILALAAALCVTWGRLVGDVRHGRALLCVMLLLFVPLLAVCLGAERHAGPALAQPGVDVAASELAPGGNMEGKELRFGIADSAIWASATTAASNGSVNSMHDSYTPLGGLVPMVFMQLGEVVFGGVGSGLYGLVLFALLAVFIAGLMVGRTPEYLGKKIEAFEMKMASLAILLPCLAVLVGTALAVSSGAGRAGVFNPGAHGFSEILYALSSAGNNNGSAFAGLSANTPFYNALLGLAMLVSRYWVMIPTLAIAGALAAKTRVPVSAGTLPTHGPLFVALVAGIVVVVGALTFFPALALGPIVEQLSLAGG